MAEDRIKMGEGDAFPIYRRTADGRHVYRIEALDAFTEMQRVGNRWLVHRVNASAYPERVRIMEMIDGADGRYLATDEEAWPGNEGEGERP